MVMCGVHPFVNYSPDSVAKQSNGKGNGQTPKGGANNKEAHRNMPQRFEPTPPLFQKNTFLASSLV
jgi:hypothetical protein